MRSIHSLLILGFFYHRRQHKRIALKTQASMGHDSPKLGTVSLNCMGYNSNSCGDAQGVSEKCEGFNYGFNYGFLSLSIEFQNVVCEP